MSSHPTRRKVFAAVAILGAAVIVIVAVTAALIAARSASQAVDEIKANQRTSDVRSANAQAERTSLLIQVEALKQQNEELARRIRSLTKYLKSQGIDLPAGLGASKVTPSSGKASAPSKPKPKPAPTSSAPAPSPPAPAAPSSPAPTPVSPSTPLACVLGICLG